MKSIDYASLAASLAVSVIGIVVVHSRFAPCRSLWVGALGWSKCPSCPVAGARGFSPCAPLGVYRIIYTLENVSGVVGFGISANL